MILSDSAIKDAMGRRSIVIEPYDEAALGGNSYDVHLGPVLKTYVRKLDMHAYDVWEAVKFNAIGRW